MTDPESQRRLRRTFRRADRIMGIAVWTEGIYLVLLLIPVALCVVGCLWVLL